MESSVKCGQKQTNNNYHPQPAPAVPSVLSHWHCRYRSISRHATPNLTAYQVRPGLTSCVASVPGSPRAPPPPTLNLPPLHSLASSHVFSVSRPSAMYMARKLMRRATSRGHPNKKENAEQNAQRDATLQQAGPSAIVLPKVQSMRKGPC